MIQPNPIATQVSAYISSVLDGRITACETVRGACNRHLEDVTRASDPDWPYVFDSKKADVACRFFPMVLRHSIGEWAGHPFSLSDWQQFCIWSLFGWVQKEDSMRRFRRAVIEVARKNGKSTLVAGIGLLCLHLDREAGAQVFTAATKRDQAAIIHGEAEKMTRASPSLAKLTTIHKLNMMVPSTDSFMRPLSSDKPYDGLNPHAVLLDEVHAWREQHRRFYDTITTGSAARRQPLFVIATTAGDDQSLIWEDEHNHACNVATGVTQDDRLFSFVASIDEKDDPFDEMCWEKANPNLGVSVKLDYLRQQAADARHKPTNRNAFIRYHCNRRVSSTEKIVNRELWLKAKGELSNWLQAEYVGAGFDLGGQDDLAACARVAKFRCGGTDESPIYRFEAKTRSYISDTASRDLTQAPWQRWIYDGLLTKTAAVIATLKDQLISDVLADGVGSVAYDPYNARQLGDDLDAEGIKSAKMPQNHGQFNEPLRAFQQALREGRFAHDGDEILSWCANNAVARVNSKDEWMIDKAASREKVDTFVALIMAFREAYFAPPQPRGDLFVYG